MSSKLSDRSDEENDRNLYRFSAYRYQLKGSVGSDGITHAAQNEIIPQDKGLYPYPRTNAPDGFVDEESSSKIYRESKPHIKIQKFL